MSIFDKDFERDENFGKRPNLDGVFHLLCSAAVVTQSKAGNEMTKLTLSIVGGEHEGYEFDEYINHDHPNKTVENLAAGQMESISKAIDHDLKLRSKKGLTKFLRAVDGAELAAEIETSSDGQYTNHSIKAWLSVDQVDG